MDIKNKCKKKNHKQEIKKPIKKKEVKKLLNLERLQFEVHYSKLAHTLGEGCINPRKNEIVEQ